MSVRRVGCKQDVTVHVISHTHWDREWYLPFQQYRIRLVGLLDDLLGWIPENPDYRAFHLDAQTVVLEDYLEVCPERRKELEALVRKRRIFVGPWYVLPDEFLVSGEALIRNLMLGHRLAREFGHVMQVGYVPDVFGQISQMPQILRGFGLNSFIFKRGYDGIKGRKVSEFIWESPDGSRVFAYYLPDGYSHGLWLNLWPDDITKSVEPIRKTLTKIGQWSSMPHVLLMNGADHLMPVPEIPGLLKRLNREFPGYRFIHTDLEAFVRQANAFRCRRPLFRGELRQNGEFADFLLYGVLSARNYLKQRNHAVQNLLEKWTEPAGAAAWLLSVPYPGKLIRQAWKYLVQNHAHDSICGCSVDSVHEQMLTRFAWAEDIGEYLAGAALTRIAGRIKLSSAPDVIRNVVLFNPLACPRSGCEEIVVELPGDFKDDVHLTDGKGDIIPSVPLSAASENKTQMHDRTYPYFEPVIRRRMLLDVSRVPAFGYAAFQVRRGKARQPAGAPGVSCGKKYVENEHWRLQLAENGTLEISDRKTGRRWTNLNAFEDTADVGDEYSYSPPENGLTVKSTVIPHKWEFVKEEPLRAGFRLCMELPLPRAIAGDRKTRSAETVACVLETTAMLDAKSRRVDILTRFQNNACDHNLRVLFPSGARAAKFSDALGTFDVVRRSIAVGKRGPNSVEDPPARHPMDGFVNVSDDNGGLLVCVAGLHEYEVKDDAERTLAISLLRAVGWLSRPDLKTRANISGPVLATPGAQCPGEHVFRYSIMPHAGNWEQGRVWKEVMEFLHPVRCVSLPLRDSLSDSIYDGNQPIASLRKPSLPENASLLAVGPDAMILSAVKKTDERNSLIVRAWNIGTKSIKAEFVFGCPVRRAYGVNLAEKRLKELAVQNKNMITIPCRPKQIVSIEVLCGREA